MRYKFFVSYNAKENRLVIDHAIPDPSWHTPMKKTHMGTFIGYIDCRPSEVVPAAKAAIWRQCRVVVPLGVKLRDNRNGSNFKPYVV